MFCGVINWSIIKTLCYILYDGNNLQVYISYILNLMLCYRHDDEIDEYIHLH